MTQEFPSWIFSQEKSDVWPHRNLHMNVHSNFKQESNKMKQPIQHVEE